MLSRIERLANAGQIESARDLLRPIETRAADLGIELDRSLVGRIEVMFALNEESYASALDLLDSLVESDPGDGESHLMRALSFIGLGREEEAKFAYQIAATIDETAYRANYGHARLELARGEISNALTLLRTAYAEKPSVGLRAHIRALETFEDNR